MDSTPSNALIRKYIKKIRGITLFAEPRLYNNQAMLLKDVDV